MLDKQTKDRLRGSFIEALDHLNDLADRTVAGHLLDRFGLIGLEPDDTSGASEVDQVAPGTWHVPCSGQIVEQLPTSLATHCTRQG